MSNALSRIACTAVVFVTLVASTNAAAYSGKVSRIYVAGNDTVFLRLAGVTCNRYWKFELTSPAAEAWYTLLLAAYHAGTTVHLTAPPCEANTNQTITAVSQDF